MQTGGLWKELQTARSGLLATIPRVPRTASLDTLCNPPPTDRPPSLPSRILARLNAPAFPKRVSSPLPSSSSHPLAHPRRHTTLARLRYLYYLYYRVS